MVRHEGQYAFRQSLSTYQSYRNIHKCRSVGELSPFIRSWDKDDLTIHQDFLDFFAR